MPLSAQIRLFKKNKFHKAGIYLFEACVRYQSNGIFHVSLFHLCLLKSCTVVDDSVQQVQSRMNMRRTYVQLHVRICGLKICKFLSYPKYAQARLAFLQIGTLDMCIYLYTRTRNAGAHKRKYTHTHTHVIYICRGRRSSSVIRILHSKQIRKFCAWEKYANYTSLLSRSCCGEIYFLIVTNNDLQETMSSSCQRRRQVLQWPTAVPVRRPPSSPSPLLAEISGAVIHPGQRHFCHKMYAKLFRKVLSLCRSSTACALPLIANILRNPPEDPFAALQIWLWHHTG